MYDNTTKGLSAAGLVDTAKVGEQMSGTETYMNSYRLSSA